jgi:hypothetical protein
MSRKKKTINIPGGEVVKRAVDAVVFAVVGRDEDPDARDPRRPLPNGTWAPPGKTETYRDLEDGCGSEARAASHRGRRRGRQVRARALGARRGAQQAGATHVDQAHVERDGAAGRAAPEPVASSGLEDGSWEAS